jgi:hypothetical protein
MNEASSYISNKLVARQFDTKPKEHVRMEDFRFISEIVPTFMEQYAQVSGQSVEELIKSIEAGKLTKQDFVQTLASYKKPSSPVTVSP